MRLSLAAISPDPRRKPPSIVRACNPMAVRPLARGQVWKGQEGEILIGGNSRFCRFIDMAHGVRAGLILLRTYRHTHKLNTVQGILERWAPPNENDTAAYVRAVCASTGWGPHDPIPEEYEALRRLAVAIIRHECGYPAAGADVVAQGLQLAGYPAPAEPLKPLRESAEIRDGVVVSGAGAGGLIALIQEHWAELSALVFGTGGLAQRMRASGCGLADWAVLLVALAVSAVALVFGLRLVRGRLRARKEGLR